MRKSRATAAICRPATPQTGLLAKLVVQFANTVDRDGDRVDRLFHHSDADRRAAADQVARQQRHVIGDIADQLPRAEDHIRDWIVLTLDAVKNGSHRKFRGVDRRGDDGPKRAEAVIPLGASPLGEGGIFADNVRCRDVVDAGVAKNELIGLVGSVSV